MGMRQKGSMDTGKHKDRQSAKMKRAPFFFPPPRGPSMSSGIPFKPRCTPLQSPASRLTRQLPRAFAPWLSPPWAPEDRIGSHHLVENWNRDGFLRRAVDGRGVWIEVECNLWFSADSLPSGTVVSLGESERKKLWLHFILCACRGESVSDLPTQQEDGWWTYYGQIFVMFQQIDPETI